MTTSLNSFISQVDTTPAASQTHRMAWNDQSGQLCGPQVIESTYTVFNASWTESGIAAIGVAAVTGITNTARLRVGMVFTDAARFTGNVTITGITSATEIAVDKTANSSGVVTLTFTSQPSTDPVFRLGYNIDKVGEVNANQGYCSLVLEGNYLRDSDNLPLMEIYINSGVSGVSESRMFNLAYDKLNKVPLDVNVAPGLASRFTISFQDLLSDNPGATFSFGRNQLLWNAVGAAADRDFSIASFAGQNTFLNMTANGDLISAPSFQIGVQSYGGSNVSKSAKIMMHSTAGTKTGAAWFVADNSGSANSVMFAVGDGGVHNSSLAYFSATNLSTTHNLLYLKARASTTTPAILIDGIQNGGTVEANKYNIWAKGYVSVRESGNTTTDRVPGVGTSTANFTATNKPGASTSVGPTAWFPVLSTTGALFWVPGWAD